jgi:hypothetical protein
MVVIEQAQRVDGALQFVCWFLDQGPSRRLP